MKLSVIIPVYNEEKILKEFYKVITEELKKIKYELIFVNDGSSDESLRVLKELSKDKKVKIISFSRNFGKEAAIYAGLKNSSGMYTAIIDSVCMIQAKRKENFMVSIVKKLGYKIMDSATDVKFVNGASDFRMFRRNVLNAII